jgi:hypothetical protein
VVLLRASQERLRHINIKHMATHPLSAPSPLARLYVGYIALSAQV